jgi:SAM-dependent methyltransferase
VSSPDILPSASLADGAETADGAGDILFGEFLAEVARAQLDAWLPQQPSLILDLSLHAARHVGLMVSRGHTVVHADPQACAPDISGPELLSPDGGGRLLTVRGDARSLDWLADHTVDAVVAEGGMLSESLAAEVTIDDVHRVLRPGGRLLLCVDSLVSGLSRLADQGCWAELADIPAADVVLVPSEDGHVSRCFWPEELHEILTDGGFDVEWVRPRTVLTEHTVVRALRGDRGRMGSLVTTELGLAQNRQGESLGSQIVASATRR